MNDPGLTELERALQQSCDDVLSDLTVPTADGLTRRVHWRYRGREFRATILLAPAASLFSLRQYVAWRAGGQHFAQLPSRPVFETQRGPFDWEIALDLGMWRWALRTAGRQRSEDDDASPGDLAGRPVRPRPGPPSLSASAAALPPREERESRHYERRPLPRGARGSPGSAAMNRVAANDPQALPWALDALHRGRSLSMETPTIDAMALVRRIRDRQSALLEGRSPQEIAQFFRREAQAANDEAEWRARNTNDNVEGASSTHSEATQ